MNIFKRDFWASICDELIERCRRFEFFYIPLTILSIFFSLPFLLIISILNSFGVDFYDA